jgi:hypothetical protein
VTEIRVRASDRSTEVAAQMLANFLSEPGEFGCLAMQALNILVTTGANTVAAMIEMELPSTLVKTLFLLFDLQVNIKFAALSVRCQLQSQLAPFSDALVSVARSRFRACAGVSLFLLMGCAIN